MRENFIRRIRALFFNKDNHAVVKRLMIKKLTPAFALLIMLFQFSGYGDDGNKPAPEKQYLERLSFTWNLRQVRVNGTDVTTAFQGISLTLEEDRTFTVNNPVEPIWPANGTFALQEISGSQHHDLVRSDGIQVHVIELSASVLRLQMQYQPARGSVSSVGGQYEFTFVK